MPAPRPRTSRGSGTERPPDNERSQSDWRVRSDGPQAFRWTLTGAEPFPIERTLILGEAVGNAIYAAARRRDLWPFPEWLHHSDDGSHGHPFYLPEDADQDGSIDHVLMFVERGLPNVLIPALAEAHRVFFGRAGEWTLEPDWMGRRVPGALFGPARRWVSATPFVTMRWRTSRRGGRERAGETPERQLRREIATRFDPAEPGRCLPAPERIELRPVGKFETRFADLERNAPRPGDAKAFAADILFPEPVWGPLAFGFGAHYGLGVFEPVGETY